MELNTYFSTFAFSTKKLTNFFFFAFQIHIQHNYERCCSDWRISFFCFILFCLILFYLTLFLFFKFIFFCYTLFCFTYFIWFCFILFNFVYLVSVYFTSSLIYLSAKISTSDKTSWPKNFDSRIHESQNCTKSRITFAILPFNLKMWLKTLRKRNTLYASSWKLLKFWKFQELAGSWSWNLGYRLKALAITFI